MVVTSFGVCCYGGMCLMRSFPGLVGGWCVVILCCYLGCGFGWLLGYVVDGLW